MGLHGYKNDDSETGPFFSEFDYGEDIEALAHKRNIRRLIEDKWEKKRLKNLCKDDLEDIENEFNWDDFDL